MVLRHPSETYEALKRQRLRGARPNTLADCAVTTVSYDLAYTFDFDPSLEDVIYECIRPHIYRNMSVLYYKVYIHTMLKAKSRNPFLQTHVCANLGNESKSIYSFTWVLSQSKIK